MHVERTGEKIFWGMSGALTFPLNLVCQGLADFLGLETLRHGTSWANYVSIRAEGVEPKYGGGERGATFGHMTAASLVGMEEEQRKWMSHSKGRFFAYLDSNAGCDTEYVDKDGGKKMVRFSSCEKVYYKFHVRLSPHTYGFGSGAACALARSEDEGVAAKVWRFSCGIVNFFSPTIKLRFCPNEVETHFTKDYELPGRAVFTTQTIYTDHLGLAGIFKQAVKGDIWGRMQANPLKTLWGLVFLINPLGILLLVAFGIYYRAHTKTSVR